MVDAPTSNKQQPQKYTGNDKIDEALEAQAQANAQAIALSTKTNTAVTTMNAITQATRKIQPG